MTNRKGSSSIKAVPLKVLAQLERGDIETATLSETLAVNFVTLARQTLPFLPEPAIDRLQVVSDKGVTVRMRAAGDMLKEFATDDQIATASKHRSDIVRGWAAYTVPDGLPLLEQTDYVRLFANDTHFGVREWAWLSIRRSICGDPLNTINILKKWAAHPAPNIRRFASEATRPRGVWATHITSLKTDPAPARVILDQLCLDTNEYVLRSVGNWLRDADKTAPQWVSATITSWESQHGENKSLSRLKQRVFK